jgi:hypothetical protein
MVLPGLRDSRLFLCCVFGTDENCDFSAVRNSIELKLGGDLGLISQMQICVHVLVSGFNCFSYCKQTNKKVEIAKKHGFRKLEFSLLFQV